MLKSELENGIECSVTDEQYQIMNTVYMSYPRFGEKEEVYRLYKQFGFQIFIDLYPRAKKISVKENEIRRLQCEVAALKEKHEFV